MNQEIGKQEDRRQIEVIGFGDTADEIELQVLDEAVRVFGEDVPLKILRTYEIHYVEHNPSVQDAAKSKKYFARVRVNVVP
ncbi:hypothetical protein AB0K16_21980 [Nonomuraea jabiensis]|uniref:hypothetical protein n=1 Tax=Nonomuraea jabiensis TaxID=882448 RepID=UPI00341954F7